MIKDVIKSIHSNDQEQLDAIYFPDKYLIIEAPAGYGKTKTMISKIAYMIASRKLDNPKKILALTFSVNAAYKIKRDVAEKLPEILQAEKISPLHVNTRVLATNYHGFCRRILKLYGYLIDNNLRNIEFLMGIGDDNINELINIGLCRSDAEEMVAFNEAIKVRNSRFIKDNYEGYINKVQQSFLNKNYIPFNAILLLVIKLFKEHPQILSFYNSYFPVVIIDEFQDTNIISWSLIQKLINKDTTAIFMGDSLQRIYGFIGAIDGLIGKAQSKYNASKIEFKKNYRFASNADLLLLDKNIRANAKNPRNPSLEGESRIELTEYKNQNEESNGIVGIVEDYISKDRTSKIAVLVKQRGNNTQKILEAFSLKKIPYFFALYSDDDPEYIDFHHQCLTLYVDLITKLGNKINKNACNRYISFIKDKYRDKLSDINLSLIKLMETFINLVFAEYKFLSTEEKIEFIKDTLESKALKQYLSYVDSQTIISTVHGAKGLEWDYVILPDMEQYSFPGWYGLCGDCPFKGDCIFDWSQIGYNTTIENKYYDELSVFYVAATRAKKEVRFTYSKTGLNSKGGERNNNLSCFLRLQGIVPIKSVV